MNLLDVTKNFATDEQAFSYLEAIRWPAGVICVACGHEKVSKIARKAGGKNKRGTLYQCLNPDCKYQFSTTSGTIFNDSHLPLKTWFMALALIVDAKKGISAVQLQKHLGIGSYRTAWYMAHRIRKAMADGGGSPKLFGTVEVDETYIGGKTHGKGTQGRSTDQKSVVMGLRQRGGPLKLVHVKNAKANTIQAVVEKHVAEDVETIVTDDFTSYPVALKNYPGRHRTINHTMKRYVSGQFHEIHTNTVESAFSLLKRGIVGNFHAISEKHLHRYLSEFEYRFNARNDANRFEATLARMACADVMTYKDLISE
jgi:transposase-like protein